jgi:hypothetical protein
MNPALVTYIGFVVAALVLLWGFAVVGRRYFVRKRKIDPGLMNTWVPLKPTTTESSEDSSFDNDEDDQDENFRADHHTRAQQNGHYSESQKKL